MIVVVSAATVGLCAPASASAALRVGAGRADVTPPPGQYLWGWFSADAVGRGVQTRLLARAIVLEQDGRKVALATADLGAMPGGLVQDVARRVAGHGFSEQSILISATHTHSGPAGFFSFDYFETIAPAPDRLSEGPRSAADPRIYGFMVRRLATAIVRADEDLGPAAAGWGSTDLLGVTRNRSLEAHLADHGLSLARGKGKVGDDPAGYRHTITRTWTCCASTASTTAGGARRWARGHRSPTTGRSSRRRSPTTTATTTRRPSASSRRRCAGGAPAGRGTW